MPVWYSGAGNLVLKVYLQFSFAAAVTVGELWSAWHAGLCRTCPCPRSSAAAAPILRSRTSWPHPPSEPPAAAYPLRPQVRQCNIRRTHWRRWLCLIISPSARIRTPLSGARSVVLPLPRAYVLPLSGAYFCEPLCHSARMELKGKFDGENQNIAHWSKSRIDQGFQAI